MNVSTTTFGKAGDVFRLEPEPKIKKKLIKMLMEPRKGTGEV